MSLSIPFLELPNLSSKSSQNISSLTIKETPNSLLISMETLYLIWKFLSEKGKVLFEFSGEIGEEFFQQLEENMCFSGFYDVKKDGNSVTGEKVDFVNDSLCSTFLSSVDIKNFGQKSFVSLESLYKSWDSIEVEEEKHKDPFEFAKPCPNCICGRKWGKNNGNTSKQGCGRCGLGDKFRCENCPFRGMPEFDMKDIEKMKVKLKEKEELGGGVELEKNNVKISDKGTVKIEI